MNRDLRNEAGVNDLVYWNQRHNATNITSKGFTITNDVFFGIVTKVRENRVEVWAPYFHGKIKITASEIKAFEKSKDGGTEGVNFLIPANESVRRFNALAIEDMIEGILRDMDEEENPAIKKNYMANLEYARILLTYFQNFKFKNMCKVVDEANRILQEPSAKLKDTGNGYQYKDKQICTITAQRYKLHWKRKHLFNYILDTFEREGLRGRLTEKELKFHNISSLYKLLDTGMKRLVIQRLDKIIAKNKKEGSKHADLQR